MREVLCCVLQTQHAELQAFLQAKEDLLLDTQTKLQEAQTQLVSAEQSAAKATHAAEQRHAAIEERARLAEQVCPPFLS